jgi:hypothetical protein
MLMVVMMPRETWTDQRLDDLNKKVDDGFDRLDRDLRELRIDMNSRFESLNRTLIAAAAVIAAALIGSTATMAGIALF